MQSGRAVSHSACKPRDCTRVEGGDSVKGRYFKQRSTPPTDSTVADFQIHQQEIQRKIKYIHVAIVESDGWQGKMGINLSSLPLRPAQTALQNALLRGTTVYRVTIYCEISHCCVSLHFIAVCTRAWWWILPWALRILSWHLHSSIHINWRLNSNVTVMQTTNSLTPWNRSFPKKKTLYPFFNKQPLTRLKFHRSVYSSPV